MFIEIINKISTPEELILKVKEEKKFPVTKKEKILLLDKINDLLDAIVLSENNEEIIKGVHSIIYVQFVRDCESVQLATRAVDVFVLGLLSKAMEQGRKWWNDSMKDDDDDEDDDVDEEERDEDPAFKIIENSSYLVERFSQQCL